MLFTKFDIDSFESDSGDSGRHLREVSIDEAARESDGFEVVSASVGVEYGYA